MTHQTISWRERLPLPSYWKKALLALLFGYFYFCLGFAAVSALLKAIGGLFVLSMEGMLIEGGLGILLTPFMLAIDAVTVAVLFAIPFAVISPVLLILLVVLQLERRNAIYAGTLIGILLVLPSKWLVTQNGGVFMMPIPLGSVGGGFMLGYAAWQERFRHLP